MINYIGNQFYPFQDGNIIFLINLFLSVDFVVTDIEMAQIEISSSS
jgi:hypothetical protein